MITIRDFVGLFLEYEYITVEIYSLNDGVVVWSGTGDDLDGIGQYCVDSVDTPTNDKLVINSDDATIENIADDVVGGYIDIENVTSEILENMEV